MKKMYYFFLIGLKSINKPYYFVVMTGFLLSCSLWNPIGSPSPSPSATQKFDKKLFLSSMLGSDYQIHMRSWLQDYLQTSSVNQFIITQEENKYLESVYWQIVNNNEILLDRTIKPNFVLIKDKQPFHFSLPGGVIVLSHGLVKKYLKSESLLIACLVYEILKSHRNIYVAQRIVPLGFMTTERLVYLTRVPFETKVTLNNWAHYAMGKAGYDAMSYLYWIQVQNKNSLDFSLMLGDTRNISLEEHYFKKFVINQDYLEGAIRAAPSSDGYYSFMKRFNYE